jgi:hypothetical protein
LIGWWGWKVSEALVEGYDIDLSFVFGVVMYETDLFMILLN